MTKLNTHYKKWLPAFLVVLAAIVAFYLMDSTKMKRPRKSALEKQVRVVKVSTLEKAAVEPTWNASGLVTASEMVKVVSEVTGTIEQINAKAKPGALLNKGEWLVKLDDTDLALNLDSQLAQLVRSEASLELEAADQRLAKEELSLVENLEEANVDMTLVLREPQLKSARAQVDIAKANIAKAEVALKRANIFMPFKGKIINRTAGTGSRVGTNSNLFEVVNVEQFWLEVKVPRSFLPLLDLNKKASLSQPSLWGEDTKRHARIVSVLPELDTRDRQVKLLLEITDPLALANNSDDNTDYIPEIFINDFLNVELKGHLIENAYVIRSHWLQSDDTIWVADQQKTLQKRDVTVLFKSRDVIYIDGDFQPGDVALTEKPSIAAVGMPVVVKNVKQVVIKKAIDFSTLQKAARKAQKKQNHKSGE